MSDYFGALMRSSGMALGLSPHTATDPFSHDYGITEVDVEVPAADAGHAAAPRASASAPSTPQPKSLEAHAATPLASPAIPGHDEAAPMETAEPDMRNDLRHGTSLPFALAADHAASLASAANPSAADHRTLVEAALRWVAGGSASPTSPIPGSPAEDTRGAGFAGSPGPSGHGNPSHAADASPRASRADASSIPHRVDTPRAAEPAVPVASSVRIAEPARPVVTTPAPESARANDGVDVTIGAIHVHVEAPTTRRTTAAPAPAPMPTRAAPAPRSGLARRALRRL